MKLFTFLFFLPTLIMAQKLTLDDVERAAAINSFEVRSKKHEQSAMEWRRKNATANYLPQINYDLTYMHLGMDKQTIKATQGQPNNPNAMYEDSFAHELSVSQPITNGGVEIYAIRLAEHIEKAFKAEQRSVTENSITSARKCYFDLIAVREMKKVAQKTIEWTKKNLETAKMKFEVGSTVKLDVLRWESELVKANSSLKKIAASEVTATYLLFHSMGKKFNESDLMVELMSLGEIEALFENSSIDQSSTIENSTTSLILKESVKIAKGQSDIAFSNFLPKVNAFYKKTWPAKDAFLPNSDASYWSAGIVISIPLFSGLRNYTSYKQSKSEEFKSIADSIAVKNNLKILKERLKANFNVLKDAAASSKKQEELAKAQLDSIQKRYDAGVDTQSHLLEVSVIVQNAELGYISSLFDALKAESEYNKITGNMKGVK